MNCSLHKHVIRGQTIASQIKASYIFNLFKQKIKIWRLMKGGLSERLPFHLRSSQKKSIECLRVRSTTMQIFAEMVQRTCRFNFTTRLHELYYWAEYSTSNLRSDLRGIFGPCTVRPTLFFKFSVPCWVNRKIWNWHLFRLIHLQCYKCLNCFCFKSTFLLKFYNMTAPKNFCT